MSDWETCDNREVTEREHDWPVSCSNYGASRDSLNEDAPCSSCGSTARTVHVSLHDEVAVATEAFRITAAYEKARPWQEKWKEVESAHQAVTEVYGGRAPGGAEEWKSITLSFFRTCHELPEAIMADSSVPLSIRRNVRRVAERNDVLRLVADVDNTRKHGGRDPGKCHAHIGELTWGDDTNPTVTILRECPLTSARALRRSRFGNGGDGQVARYLFAAWSRPLTEWPARLSCDHPGIYLTRRRCSSRRLPAVTF